MREAKRAKVDDEFGNSFVTNERVEQREGTWKGNLILIFANKNDTSHTAKVDERHTKTQLRHNSSILWRK